MARIEVGEGIRRRDRPVGDEAVVATPVRVALPVIATVASTALAAVVSELAGLSGSAALVAAGAVFGAATVFAHRTVTSTLAGIMLLLIRPYSAGERIRLQSPIDGCLVDAVVVHVGVANTTLVSETGLLVVPNNRLLRNPAAPAPAEQPCPEPCS
jgi:small-conductance mechanosensitive channel